ncbi:MAG: biotin/lipoyl-containing protein [Desulfobacterales bacterium]|jgi:biotin carboxyl carrier protein|nr:biotin/lipoyl-containing protein [Desulfobacterales bacterium]
MTKYTLNINEQTFDVEIVSILGGKARVTVNQMPYEVLISGDSVQQPVAAAPVAPAMPLLATPRAPAAARPAPAAVGGSGVITAPIPGKILGISVNLGDSVTAGQTVAIMEAMKMENNLTSPIAGKVKEIRVNKDADVSTGDVIMVIG